MSDFLFINGGSVCKLIPKSDAGKAWAAENLPEPAGWELPGNVIEPRYVGPILEGIEADGLTIS